ncbi:MAG: hypothetical protein K6E54_08080 [Bacteroidaceae bacterium]|nr:hypothetical protein [Bacteroidaceae bacterium]
MAKGILTVTDRDSGETISVNAYSGGLGADHTDGVSLPIPLGEYDILEHGRNSEFLRLEAKDSCYGNDQVDGVKISQGTIRLHYKGLTYGCLSVEMDSGSEEYSNFMDLIKGTSTSEVTVRSKSRNPFRTKEDLTKYGTLSVFQSKSIVVTDLYAPEQYKQKYTHQRMR